MRLLFNGFFLTLLLCFVFFGQKAVAQSLILDTERLADAIKNRDTLEVYHRLGLHCNFMDVYRKTYNQKRQFVAAAKQDQLSELDIKDDYKRYSNNPFLTKYIIDFKPDENSRLVSDKVKKKIRGSITENYKWQDYLYAEEVVLKQKEDKVDLRDVADNYSSAASSSSSDLLNDAADNLRVQQNKAGGLNAAAFAEGLSSFVVERAQEELSITFLDNFKKKLKDTSFVELPVIFPNTVNFLEEFDVSNYGSLMQLSKRSFEGDLKQLAINMPRLLTLSKYRENQNSPKVYTLAVLYDAIDLVYKGSDTDEVMFAMHKKLVNRKKEIDNLIYRNLAEQLQGTTELADLQSNVEKLGNEISYAWEENQKLDAQTKEYLKILIKNRRKEEIKELNTIFKESKMIVNNVDGWIRRQEKNEIPYALKGERDYDKLIEEASLEDYDKLFDLYGKQGKAIKNIAIGLEYTRSMVSKDPATRMNNAQKMVQLAKIRSKVKRNITNARKNFSADLALKQMGEYADTLDAKLGRELSALEQHISSLKTAKSAESYDLDEYDLVRLKYIRSAFKREFYKKADSLQNIIEEVSKNETPNPELTTPLKNYLKRSRTVLEENFEAIYIKSGYVYYADLYKDLLSEDDSEEDESEVLIEDPNSDKPYIIYLSDSIEQTLNTLENKYCGDLVKTKVFIDKLSKAVEYSTHIMYSFRSGKDGKKWIDREQLKEIMEDDFKRNIMMGLLYERINTVFPEAASKRNIATSVTKYSSLINSMATHRDSIKSKQDRYETLTFKDYYPAIKNSIEVLNAGISTTIDGKSLFPSLKQVPELSGETMELFENVFAKDYGMAIYNSMEILKILTPQPADLYMTKAERKLLYASETPEEKTLRKSLEKKRKKQAMLINSVLKYGTFMANIVNANNSAEVQRAIEAAALPAGSSRIKRETKFNISINSYFAPYAGLEVLTSQSILAGERMSPSFGLSIPVGIALSTGHIKRGALTAFIPILDVGTVTAFRLNQDNQTAALPEITFGNLIAPGGYLIYGVPRSPFSFGAGVQYGPQLREITVNSTTIQSGAYRAMFYLAVDVPLFNLYKSAQ